MGLDWCLNAKRRRGAEDDAAVEAAEQLVEQLATQDEEMWNAYLKTHNKGERPFAHPNDVSDAFDALPETRLHRKALKDAKAAAASYYISTMEEIGAPRVGIDEEATEWARKNFEDVPETRWPAGKPPVAAYLEENYGKYVPDLARVKEGLGACSGMFVGADSFRGKIVGNSASIVGPDLAEEAYKDMDPEALQDYGTRLRLATEGYLDDKGWSRLIGMPREKVAELTEEDGLWDAWYCLEGAKWCTFWGSRGFSMHAWY